MKYGKRDNRKWVKISVKDQEENIYIGFDTFKERENFTLFINEYKNILATNVFRQNVPRVDFYMSNSKGFYTLNGQDLNIIDKYFDGFLGVKELMKEDVNNFVREILDSEKPKDIILEDITCKNENCPLCDIETHRCANDVVRSNKAPCYGRNKIQKRRYDEEFNILNKWFYPKSNGGSANGNNV